LPDPEVTDQADVLEGLLAIMHMSRSLERVDAGLSPSQYRILKLAGAGGERSARLAERLAVAKPTLTSIADSVVAAGLARREAEPGDRRVVRLHLTEAGSAAVARADEAYGQWLTSLLDMTGAAGEILADLRLIDAALVEQRRARKAAGCASSGKPGFETGSAEPVTSTTAAGRS
jgi:DNA-binding MarR family transcriptional regulator